MADINVTAPPIPTGPRIGELEWFVKGNIAGIPVPLIIILVLIIVVVYLILTRMPRAKTFEGLDMKKEVTNYLKDMYDLTGIPAHKKLMIGTANSGYAIGTMPVFWNKRLKIKENLASNKYRELKDAVEESRKKGEIKEELVEMIGIKRCSSSFLMKQLGVWFGYNVKFLMVDKDAVAVGENLISINPLVIPEEMFGVVMFSKAARSKVENISFRINRQNELKEIADQIPKQRYFEHITGAWVAREEKKAEIEGDKWKAQREGAQE